MTDNAEDQELGERGSPDPNMLAKGRDGRRKMAADGTMTVLVKRNERMGLYTRKQNKIGDPPMCMNPMGMRWMMDALQGKPKPTNTAPGMIYMLCGATQRSNTNPSTKPVPLSR